MRIPALLALSALLAVPGCGGEKVDYEDPDATTLVDADFNDTDLKQIADKLSQSMMRSGLFAEGAAKKPVIMVEQVANRTHEHIDIKSLTDKIRTGIVRSGRVEVVDETARKTLPEEYQYQASGNVDPAAAKGPGRQTAPDFILRGDFADQRHEAKNQKTLVIWYKITLQLTDVSKGTMVWTDDHEIKKVRRK